MFLVTFEGTEKTGKTTQSKKVKDILEDRGYKVGWTHEPGGTDIGKKIRKLILENEMDPVTETLLFFADRAEHFEDVLKDNPNEILICDRYYISTVVYQCMQKGIKENVVDWLLGFSTNYLKPDLQFTVTSDKAFGVPDKNDKHDNAGEKFRQQIQEKYIDLTSKINDFDTFIIDTSNGDWGKYSKNIADKIENKYKMEG